MRRRGETPDGLDEEFVRAAIAGEPSAEGRDHPEAVCIVEWSDPFPGLAELQECDAPFGREDPPEFPESLHEVAKVSQDKRAHHRGHRAVMQGEMQDISLQEVELPGRRGLRMQPSQPRRPPRSDLEHRRGQVEADYLRAP